MESKKIASHDKVSFDFNNLTLSFVGDGTFNSIAIFDTFIIVLPKLQSL